MECARSFLHPCRRAQYSGAVREISVGATVAGFRLDELVGRGGMGVVYRATHLFLDQVVALKLVAPEHAQDERFRERFKQESKLAASIRHPNVIPIHHAGEEDELLFIAMDYVEGSDLDVLIGRDGLEPRLAVRIVVQIAAALDAAHARGLVHRDVKPANVLLMPPADDPHVYLTDFGLTKFAAQSGFTVSGQFVGTPDYAAPEQVRGDRLDARADVYALGCVLYHALSGRVPYGHDTPVAKMWAHVHEAPPGLGDVVRGPSSAFDEVVSRAMAKAPNDRYPSAGDLARAALAAYHRRELPRPRGSVAVGEAASAETTPATTTPESATSGPGPSPTAERRPGDEPAGHVARPVSPPAAPPGPAWPPLGPLAAPGAWRGATPPRARVARRRRRLPAEYRFGWLALPAVAVVAALAFTMPVEIKAVLESALLCVVAVVVASRVVAAIRWHARREEGEWAVRQPLYWLWRDTLGLLGLCLLALGAAYVSLVLIAAASSSHSNAAGRSLVHDLAAVVDARQRFEFSSASQIPVFLHLIFTLPLSAVATLLLCRGQGDLSRPLLLPRAARLLHSGPWWGRAVFVGLCLTLVLVGALLTHGFAVTRAPQGSVCALAPLTCRESDRARASSPVAGELYGRYCRAEPRPAAGHRDRRAFDLCVVAMAKLDQHGRLAPSAACQAETDGRAASAGSLAPYRLCVAAGNRLRGSRR